MFNALDYLIAEGDVSRPADAPAGDPAHDSLCDCEECEVPVILSIHDDARDCK